MFIEFEKKFMAFIEERSQAMDGSQLGARLFESDVRLWALSQPEVKEASAQVTTTLWDAMDWKTKLKWLVCNRLFCDIGECIRRSMAESLTFRAVPDWAIHDADQRLIGCAIYLTGALFVAYAVCESPVVIRCKFSPLPV